MWVESLETSHDIYYKSIEKKKVEAIVNSKENKWYNKTMWYTAPLGSTVNTDYLISNLGG